MIEIAAAVCMISAPERCRDVTLTFEAEAVTQNQCMMYGQMELAKWSGDNPNWRIAKWTCRPAGQVAKL
jgi:hypothetical protein